MNASVYVYFDTLKFVIFKEHQKKKFISKRKWENRKPIQATANFTNNNYTNILKCMYLTFDTIRQILEDVVGVCVCVCIGFACVLRGF